MLQGMIQRFAEQAPVAVMVRGLLANILSPGELDTIFRETAVRQHEDELLFSSIVELLQLVVTKSHKSMRAAYLAHHEQFQVSLTSVYNKLNGVETQVSRALVRETAQRMGQVIEALRGPQTKFLGRYRRRILDGSHLAATEHRLKELRTLHGGPLPGQALVVLEPEWGLVTDMIPCEDGHAQERSLLVDLLDIVEPDDLWIADRNFCTVLMLHEIAASKAYFLVRQHAGLPWEPRGERRRVGRSQTGWVYEQQGVVPDGMGNDLPVRRLTLELDEATTEGERTIHILTNLPSSVKDFSNPAIEPYLARFVRGANGIGHRERIKVMKLLWDAIGSEFGGRHELYERNYAGNHEEIRLQALLSAQRSGQMQKMQDLVDQCMADYDERGWTSDDWVWPGEDKRAAE